MTESELKHYTHNYAHTIECQSDVHEWIDSRVKDQPTSEVEHIIDYLASDRRPRRLDRATYSQMKHNADKWSYSLQKKGKDIDDTDGVETILDFGDGFRFVKLISKEAYEREGYCMSHCVSSYFDRDVTIYSLRDSQNQPHCTVEHDGQIRGKGNDKVHSRYVDYVIEFIEFIDMEVGGRYIECIGYEKIPLPFIEWVEFVEGGIFREEYKRKDAKVTYSDAVIVFTDLEEAVSYRGDKVVLLDADVDFKQVTDLGQLSSIGGNAYFMNSQITDLGQLQSIGGLVNFENSQITDLGPLQFIGRGAHFSGSQVTDLGQLRFIMGSAGFCKSQVTDLGQLQFIGGGAVFVGSNVTDWSNVEIKGEVFF